VTINHTASVAYCASDSSIVVAVRAVAMSGLNTATSASVQLTIQELVPLFESTLVFSVSLSVVESIVERNQSAPIVLILATGGALICATWCNIRIAAAAYPAVATTQARLQAAILAVDANPTDADARNKLASAELTAIIAPVIELVGWAVGKLVRVLVQFESVLIASALSTAVSGANATNLVVMFILFGLSLSYGLSSAARHLATKQ